ncbi:MAG TPA: 2OG-Fe(II) oxygenase [Moraxellaceae bacterium]|nr:2OG-Fe(II) oxygenase [Moraxellaceae bacterium]
MPEHDIGLTAFPPGPWESAVEALVRQGWVVLPAALPALACQSLRQEAEALRSEGGFSPARVGRTGVPVRETAVRGDELCWLEAGMPAGGRYLEWLEGLRVALNRELFLGLAEVEAQYAYYPAGAFYKTHVDRHRDSNARVISAVCYLNPSWPADAGGEFVMYDPEGRERFRQPPEAATLVLFRSEDMPHEVLPATQERWSIASWFRTRV